MNVRVEFRNADCNKVVKWSKLALFALGALIAFPMVAVAWVLTILEFAANCFVSMLTRITDVDVNFRP